MSFPRVFRFTLTGMVPLVLGVACIERADIAELPSTGAESDADVDGASAGGASAGETGGSGGASGALAGGSSGQGGQEPGSGGQAGGGAGSAGAPLPACSPCRAWGADRDACYADPRCEAIPYWGESVVACSFDKRGFAQNCPFEGCRAIGMVFRCPDLQELASSCPSGCGWNAYAITEDGCRECRCEDNAPGPVAQCALDALCQDTPDAGACEAGP